MICDLCDGLSGRATIYTEAGQIADVCSRCLTNLLKGDVVTDSYGFDWSWQASSDTFYCKPSDAFLKFKFPVTTAEVEAIGGIFHPVMGHWDDTFAQRDAEAVLATYKSYREEIMNINENVGSESQT